MTAPQPTEDAAARAKTALSEMRYLGMPNIHTVQRFRELTLELVASVPVLVAEVERLRRQPGCCCGGCVL